MYELLLILIFSTWGFWLVIKEPIEIFNFILHYFIPEMRFYFMEIFVSTNDKMCGFWFVKRQLRSDEPDVSENGFCLRLQVEPT
jgi:hypothetical protein